MFTKYLLLKKTSRLFTQCYLLDCFLKNVYLHGSEMVSWTQGYRLTTEDLTVGPPEVCSFGRPVVELISVCSKNQPAERDREGFRSFVIYVHLVSLAHLLLM